MTNAKIKLYKKKEICIHTYIFVICLKYIEIDHLFAYNISFYISKIMIKKANNHEFKKNT